MSDCHVYQVKVHSQGHWIDNACGYFALFHTLNVVSAAVCDSSEEAERWMCRNDSASALYSFIANGKAVLQGAMAAHGGVKAHSSLWNSSIIDSEEVLREHMSYLIQNHKHAQLVGGEATLATVPGISYREMRAGILTVDECTLVQSCIDRFLQAHTLHRESSATSASSVSSETGGELAGSGVELHRVQARGDGEEGQVYGFVIGSGTHWLSVVLNCVGGHKEVFCMESYNGIVLNLSDEDLRVNAIADIAQHIPRYVAQVQGKGAYRGLGYEEALAVLQEGRPWPHRVMSIPQMEDYMFDSWKDEQHTLDMLTSALSQRQSILSRYLDILCNSIRRSLILPTEEDPTASIEEWLQSNGESGHPSYLKVRNGGGDRAGFACIFPELCCVVFFFFALFSFSLCFSVLESHPLTLFLNL